MSHIPVLLDEVMSFTPEVAAGKYLDVTFGGGGHFFSILNKCQNWSGEAWDRDSQAVERFEEKLQSFDRSQRQVNFFSKRFSAEPVAGNSYDFILADLGLSSFQLDAMDRGFSVHSESPPDMRMNSEGENFDFAEWINRFSELDLESIFVKYAEEPRAKNLAKKIKNIESSKLQSAKDFAREIERALGYRDFSRKSPAIRIFQAFRMAINEEEQELRSFLEWSPRFLKKGGRLAVISFHSIEDRLVKRSFQQLNKNDDYEILTRTPVQASTKELNYNSRSRSAKLRVIEKK